MLDFTLKSYASLIDALKNAGYSFQTFEDFLRNPLKGKIVMMRHDVDELACNALKMARLENEHGIRATYFFRIVKQSNNPDVIREIVELGHSVGYHYEDLTLSAGDYEKAIKSFQKNLEYFRQYYPVATVCMHGSSTSKFDNRSLWDKYALSDFGLIGEPYLSLNFDEIFYLTDTGHAWDGGKYAVRDVVANNNGLSFHSTKQVVDCIKKGGFPEQAMILAHTLWSDNAFQWSWLHAREFLRNNIKHFSKNHAFVAKVYGFFVRQYWK